MRVFSWCPWIPGTYSVHSQVGFNLISVQVCLRMVPYLCVDDDREPVGQIVEGLAVVDVLSGNVVGGCDLVKVVLLENGSVVTHLFVVAVGL